jgi:hypothetical protein
VTYKAYIESPEDAEASTDETHEPAANGAPVPPAANNPSAVPELDPFR